MVRGEYGEWGGKNEVQQKTPGPDALPALGHPLTRGEEGRYPFQAINKGAQSGKCVGGIRGGVPALAQPAEGQDECVFFNVNVKQLRSTCTYVAHSIIEGSRLQPSMAAQLRRITKQPGLLMRERSWRLWSLASRGLNAALAVAAPAEVVVEQAPKLQSEKPADVFTPSRI